MPVIKSDNLAAQRAAPFSMADIEKQARAILLAARHRAERLLVEAQQEAEQLKHSARAQGLAEGEKQGLARGLEEGRKLGREQALAERRQELAQLAGALAQSASDLDSSRLDFESQARNAVVELAVAIAGRVSKRQGALDPQVLLNNIDDALKLVVHAVDVRIAIHPTQKAHLEEVLPAIQAKWPAMKHVELIADGTLAPGGCRVFSRGGHIDADLDLQLTRIAAELLPSQNENE